MRVTFRMVNQSMQNHILKNYERLSKLQEQIATGRRLNRPSDDPVDVTNDLEIRARIQALGSYRRNIDDAVAFCAVTDSSLVSMNEIFQRLKEMAIQASNDTYAAEERVYLNREVEQLLRQFVTLVSTTYKGEFIFGGTNSKTAPYTVAAGTYSATVAGAAGVQEPLWDNSVAPPITNVYSVIPGSVVVTMGAVTMQENVDYTIDYATGDITRIVGGGLDVAVGTPYTIDYDWIPKASVPNTDPIYREIEESVTPQINTAADDFIVDNANNVNAFNAIVDFGQALLQNNPGNIRIAMDDLDIAFQNVLAVQASNGARVNRFELTRERNEIQDIEVTRLQSELEDADLAEVISEFSLLENVYTASLQAGARVIQPSLVDFLR